MFNQSRLLSEHGVVCAITMLDISHYTLTPDDKLLYETWRSFRDIGCYEDQEHRGFVLYQTAQTPGMLSFDVLIHFVYVSPAFRRQGIGRTLVDRIDKEKRTGAFCLDRPIFWRRIGWHVNGFIATNYDEAVAEPSAPAPL